jgi:hypothetical protein
MLCNYDYVFVLIHVSEPEPGRKSTLFSPFSVPLQQLDAVAFQRSLNAESLWSLGKLSFSQNAQKKPATITMDWLKTDSDCKMWC